MRMFFVFALKRRQHAAMLMLNDSSFVLFLSSSGFNWTSRAISCLSSRPEFIAIKLNFRFCGVNRFGLWDMEHNCLYYEVEKWLFVAFDVININFWISFSSQTSDNEQLSDCFPSRPNDHSSTLIPFRLFPPNFIAGFNCQRRWNSMKVVYKFRFWWLSPEKSRQLIRIEAIKTNL